ncbi:hypothetical protein AAMO2058_000743700 [Amorphochlora amoebiformis]
MGRSQAGTPTVFHGGGESGIRQKSPLRKNKQESNQVISAFKEGWRRLSRRGRNDNNLRRSSVVRSPRSATPSRRQVNNPILFLTYDPPQQLSPSL